MFKEINVADRADIIKLEGTNKQNLSQSVYIHV